MRNYWNSVGALRASVYVLDVEHGSRLLKDVAGLMSHVSHILDRQETAASGFSTVQQLLAQLLASTDTVSVSSSDAEESRATQEPDVAKALLAVGITDPHLLDSFASLELVQKTGRSLLYRSTVVSLVSVFEVLLSDVVHEYFRAFPRALGDKSRKDISVEDLVASGSIEAALEQLAEKRTETLLHRGLPEWSGFLLERGVKLAGALPHDFREVFLRRNLIVHRGGVVSADYLEKVGPEPLGPAAGAIVPVTEDYVRHALDVFAVTGILLVDACWRQFWPKEYAIADATLVDYTFESLNFGRWAVASALAEYASKSADGDERRIQMINYWLAEKRLGNWARIECTVRNTDLSGWDPRLQLAALSLREDEAGFYELLPPRQGGRAWARPPTSVSGF